MIRDSATKGYAHIVIQIYHNNKHIDFDSIREEYEQDIKELERKEKQILKEIKDEK